MTGLGALEGGYCGAAAAVAAPVAAAAAGAAAAVAAAASPAWRLLKNPVRVECTCAKLPVTPGSGEVRSDDNTQRGRLPMTAPPPPPPLAAAAPLPLLAEVDGW